MGPNLHQPWWGPNWGNEKGRKGWQLGLYLCTFEFSDNILIILFIFVIVFYYLPMMGKLTGEYLKPCRVRWVK